ncbi:MAG: PdxA family dehydrogenase [Chloroflexota bacterium]
MAVKPIVAIALGDAAGIGPEVVAKVLAQPATRDLCRPLVVGNAWVLRQALSLVGSALTVRALAGADQASYGTGAVDLVETANLAPEQLRPGEICLATGRESAETLRLAARLVATGQAHGLVSAPVNKAALALAGHGLAHAQLVAAAVGATAPLTSLMASPRLNVVNLTGHCSLAEAIGQVRRERIVAALQAVDAGPGPWGSGRPRIAVCALNPHRGENGHFGREESEEIAPAIAEARAAGILASGPQAVDTVFARALNGEFDVVLALYHDQGLAPLKTVAWHEAASLCLGMPIPFATTDHGTAFDIAWRGQAHPGSLQAALRAVVRMCQDVADGE